MIIDSSSLIIFAKANRLDIFIKLYGDVDITKEIYKETVEDGLTIDAPDAKLIREYVENKKIKILELNEKHKIIFNNLKKIYSQLGDGEASAIVLALQIKNGIIIDEKIARQVSKLYGLKPIGTMRVLLEAYKKRTVNEGELEEIVAEIIKYKFRIGADVLNEFWNAFHKLKKKRS